MMCNSQAVGLLEKVLAIIEDKTRWTQGAYARNAAGERVWAGHPKACQWCVLGAMHLVEPDDSKPVFVAAHKLLIDVSTGESIVSVNDDKGHEAIVDVLRRAIAAASPEKNKDAK